MDLQIHKMIISDSEWIEKIGWMLYDEEDLFNGISKDTLHRIVDLIVEASEQQNGASDRELEEAYQEGYDEGYRDAKYAYECDCDCD